MIQGSLDNRFLAYRKLQRPQCNSRKGSTSRPLHQYPRLYACVQSRIKALASPDALKATAETLTKTLASNNTHGCWLKYKCSRRQDAVLCRICNTSVFALLSFKALSPGVLTLDKQVPLFESFVVCLSWPKSVFLSCLLRLWTPPTHLLLTQKPLLWKMRFQVRGNHLNHSDRSQGSCLV